LEALEEKRKGFAGERPLPGEERSEQLVVVDGTAASRDVVAGMGPGKQSPTPKFFSLRRAQDGRV
jgi:hypothetical protein